MSDSHQQSNSQQGSDSRPPPQSQPPQPHRTPPPSQPPQSHRPPRYRSHEQTKIDRLYTPQLKFTNFSAQAPIVTKYSEQEGSKVIVIHPGSKYLRIGYASEAFPYVVPHVIARKMRIENQVEKDKMNVDNNEEVKEKNEDGKDPQEKEIKDLTDENIAPKSESPEDWSGGSATEEVEEEDEEQFKNVVNEIKKELKERMKNAKRRPVANAQTQVLSFNKASRPEIIADHNDPYKVDWTMIEEDAEYYVGEKVNVINNITTFSESTFKLFYPIQHGEFNTRDYNSIKAVVGDLETIWTETIQEKLEIPLKNFKAYSVILVIPDIYNRLYVTEMITMLLRYLEFQRVFVAQESVCVSFGAGISVACTVDVGAQTTTITCVEDGMCIPDSRICLHYGGDDITSFFIRLLRKSKFPYVEMDLNRMYDWMLAEEMKEKFCTLDEVNLAIQLNEFYVRAPNKPTLKYQIRTYDDSIIAPMCLFYPHLINFHKKMMEFPPKFASYVVDDITEGMVASTGGPPTGIVVQKPKLSVTTQVSQAKPSFPSPSPQQRDSPGPTTPLRIENSAAPNNRSSPPSAVTSSLTRIHNAFLIDPISTLPLDDAIIQSINSAATEERAKKFYASILMVGGGGLIPGIHKMLEDRLSQRSIQVTDKFEVLGSPRDLDPRLLAWKGGSVMSKLEIVNELWINSNEWEELGVRCLREKALFVW
ncbi:10896_t:CDS:10 [Acaulospora colombiana]|uniref:10896_t:CDS:1 n=1 Tax=Acaulospora colombiana TaxID=27376 RepID=A0ACA9L0U7_9GLOM|nr:10896_t:CDS:10 [Acaulospora colombiana]